MAKPTSFLLPREHGAYAQLGVALLSALALAPGWRSLSQGVLSAALFFASEPILILLGGRGTACLASGKEAALRRLATLGVLASIAVSLGWKGMPMAYGWSLLPPALLGLALFGLFLGKLERTAGGEVLAAWAFAAGAPAVVLLGGGGPRRATLLAILLAALFTLGTAVVHGHLMALRNRGTAPRGAAFLLGAFLVAGAGVLAGRGMLPRTAGAVFLPMTLAALGLWIRPPAPRHLKRVGWVAALCALAGGALAVGALR
jgi:hypothetical protein